VKKATPPAKRDPDGLFRPILEGAQHHGGQRGASTVWASISCSHPVGPSVASGCRRRQPQSPKNQALLTKTHLPVNSFPPCQLPMWPQRKALLREDGNRTPDTPPGGREDRHSAEPHKPVSSMAKPAVPPAPRPLATDDSDKRVTQKGRSMESPCPYEGRKIIPSAL
jgi:hypothetical protein